MKQSLINILIRLTTLLNDSTKETLFGFFATIKVSLILTPFILVWDKISNWGVNNQDYILIVLGAILVDWMFGTLKHIFFVGDFSLKQNAIGLTTKIALATAGGFLFEGLNYIVSGSEYVVTVTQMVTRIIILMYPGISAFENIYIVSGKKFPPDAWMKRLTKWKDTLNPKDLIDNDNKKFQ